MFCFTYILARVVILPSVIAVFFVLRELYSKSNVFLWIRYVRSYATFYVKQREQWFFFLRPCFWFFLGWDLSGFLLTETLVCIGGQSGDVPGLGRAENMPLARVTMVTTGPNTSIACKQVPSHRKMLISWLLMQDIYWEMLRNDQRGRTIFSTTVEVEKAVLHIAVKCN